VHCLGWCVGMTVLMVSTAELMWDETVDAEEPHHADYIQRQLLQRQQAWRRRRAFAAAFVYRNASRNASAAAGVAAATAATIDMATHLHMDVDVETDVAGTLMIRLADEAPTDLAKAVIRWL
jgi:hypothetical protein